MILRVLTGLLVMQLALTIALYWPEEQGSDSRASLIDGSITDVESLQVSEFDSEGSLLTRATGSNDWSLESTLPADKSKAEQLLSALMAQDPGYPIATSTAARKRFAVAEEVYERKIRIAASSGETIVYLGSSPSFRKIHARVADAEEIYVLELNSYDAPTGDDQWLDQQLLAKDKVLNLVVDGTAFDQVDGEWRTAAEQGPSDDAESTGNKETDEEAAKINTDALEQLSTSLASLRVTGLADDEDAAAPGASVLVLEGNADSGAPAERFAYTFFHQVEEERYFVRSSAYPQMFSTSAYDAERLIEAAATLLRREVEEAATNPASEAAPSLSSASEMSLDSPEG